MLTSFLNHVWGGITLCYSYLNKYHFSGNLPKFGFSTITCGNEHQVPFGFRLNWMWAQNWNLVSAHFRYPFDTRKSMEMLLWLRSYREKPPGMPLTGKGSRQSVMFRGKWEEQGRNHIQPGAYWVSVLRSEDWRPKRMMKMNPSKGHAHFHKK